jgi:hypothetical protein
MQVSGRMHDLAALPIRKAIWCPLDRRLDGPQNRAEYCGKDNRTTANPPVARRYTDWALHITKSSELKVKQRFGRTYHLLLQDRRVSWERNQNLLPASCRLLLLSIIFDRRDGGEIFLRKVDWLSTVYTLLSARHSHYKDGFFLHLTNI